MPIEKGALWEIGFSPLEWNSGKYMLRGEETIFSQTRAKIAADNFNMHILHAQEKISEKIEP